MDFLQLLSEPGDLVGVCINMTVRSVSVALLGDHTEFSLCRTMERLADVGIKDFSVENVASAFMGQTKVTYFNVVRVPVPEPDNRQLELSFIVLIGN